MLLTEKRKKTRIIFFDIDGTLIPFGEKDLRPGLKQALKQKQQEGVKLFLATGRAPYFLPEFQDFSFDGALCFNGGYCYDRGGVIYRHPIRGEDIPVVVRNAKDLGRSVALASAARFGSNFFEENLEEYLHISENTCNVLKEYEAFEKEEIYQMMIGATADEDEALVKGTSSVMCARWWDRAVDIIPKDSGKDKAMEIVLSHFGFSVEESMAFGDGGNDLDMIRFAGIGVAMGNAAKEVKAAADYVALSAEEDGVSRALLELF